MSTSVTYCKECGACNWAGEEKCTACGGELEPTFQDYYNQLYTTDPEFKKFVDEQKEGGYKPELTKEME